MRVSSPVGEYEYTVESVTVEGGRIVVAGKMGMWKSSMVIEPSDFANAAKWAARPAGMVGAVLLAGAALRRR